jgi:RNA polymerase sigma-70 factor, ECF subfamily
MPPGRLRFRNRHPAGGVEGAVVGRPLEDQQLLDRACRGDADAYEHLVRAHQHVAFRTACLLAGSPADAEEAAQEAFVKAWRALPRFRAGAPFRPWLLAIVANEARSRRRAESRRVAWTARAQAAAPDSAADPSPETAVLVSERRAILLQAIAALPERDRLVLHLRYLLDLSERETAAVLGCRQGTVKSRLSRALERLREEMSEAP